MNREEQAKAFVELADQFQSWIGKKLLIAERITDQEFDRHGTSTVYFGLILMEVNWRFSGGRLMLTGTEDELYEISPLLLECRIATGEIETVEALGTSTIGTPLMRRTLITVR